METVERKIEDLIPAEYNPRQMTAKQVEDLTASMKRFGVVEPLLINMHADRKNIVIGGHQRLRVWKGLGHETIPCWEIEVNRDRERELNVRLNRNLGSWDWDALANEFDIGELDDWGFNENELTMPDWEDYSEDQTGNADRSTSNSDSVLICFGEYVGRVEKELAQQATHVVQGMDEDPNAACTALCRKIVDEN